MTAGKDRVQKLIANAGLCSRREAEQWIYEGRVQVNGITIKLGDQAGPSDKVTINGAPLPKAEQLYIMLNKPKGFVTTRSDLYGKRTVMDLIDATERVYPVGRLDKDTTGLLLLTNDGDFANKVMHPRYEIEKTYIATLDKTFQKAHAAILSKGVRLEEGVVHAKVRQISPRRVSVVLHQGYNHVVKRIFSTLGYWVVALERTKVGQLTVDVPEGSYRFLTKQEIQSLSSSRASKTPARGASGIPNRSQYKR